MRWFLIIFVIASLAVSGCFYKNAINNENSGINKKPSEAVKKSDQISVKEIILKYIPKPFNPRVNATSLEFTGKWKGNIMPSTVVYFRVMSDRVNELEKTVDIKLNAIISQKSFSSNPYDFIKNNKDYMDIVNLGQPALDYMLSKFEQTTDNGLKEYVMAIACSEILGEKPEQKDWSSGREWYQKHLKRR